jgi:hypothetical protein
MNTNLKRLLDWDEQIKAHLMWIWGGEVGFMKRGIEGMLIITDRRIVFISKTDMTYRVHDVYSRRQRIRFEQDENIFRPIEDYGINELRVDMNKSVKNIEMPFSKTTDLFIEEKRWGTALRISFIDEEKKKHYKFSVVKSWVKYPAKDPLEFQRMDWSPVITLFKNFR